MLKRNDKINVLHVVYSLTAGGAERIVLNYAKKINKNEFNIQVCAIKDGGIFEKELKNNKIKYFVLKKKGILDLIALKRLIKILKDERIDIIHIHGFTANYYATLAGKFCGTKIIIRTEHNIENKNGVSNFARVILRDILGIFHKKIITVSNSVKISHQKLKIFSKYRHTTIYNGVDEIREIDEASKRKYKNEFKAKDGEILIGIIASLTEQKGHEVLLDAMSKVDKKNYMTKTIIVGGGPRLNEIKKLAYKLDLTDKVVFTGVRSDTHKLIQVFDIVCLSSHWEGLPMVVLEAMAASKPVVATTVGGNAEAVINQETGILVPGNAADEMAEAIVCLINNETLRRKMGKSGKNRFNKKFTLTRFIKETENLYKHLYEKNTKPNLC